MKVLFYKDNLFGRMRTHISCGNGEIMDERIKVLEDLGCDIEGAMERFLEDEEFYLECYDKVIIDPCFEELKEALDAHDLKRGFECAHTLKGVLSNLGLTSLYNIIFEMVETLRAGSEEDLLGKYQILMAERAKYPSNGIKR